LGQAVGRHVETALATHKPVAVDTLESILAADAETRDRIPALVAALRR
jgi:hypothetical protein